MKREYLKSAFKVAKLSRLIAKLIDLSIVFLLSVLLYPLGLIISIIYMGFSDYIFNGQSLGKGFMGFSVISLEDGSPCSLNQSFIRNLPIIIPLFLAIIPIWGWVLSAFIGIFLCCLEVYFIITLDSGNRLGDIMADTTVMASNNSRLAKHKKKSVSVVGKDACVGPL